MTEEKGEPHGIRICSVSRTEKKRRVVGEEQGSNGINFLVSNGNDLAIQLHVEPTS